MALLTGASNPREMGTENVDLSGAGDRFRALAVALAVIFAAFLAASALVAPVTGALVAAGLVAPESVLWSVARTITQFVAFALAVGAFLALARDRDLIAVGRPTARQALLVAGGVVALLVLQVGFVQLLSALGLGAGQNQVIATGAGAPVFYLYMIPVSILFVGPAEELLFRGAVQGSLRRAYGPAAAVLVASALFGLMHVSGVNGTMLQRFLYAAVAAALGCVLGALYERTANLLVPALTHGLYNAALFLSQYLLATAA